MTIIVTDTLPVGFKHGEQLIRTFTVRPTKVRDSIEAVEEVGSDASQARLRVAVEARQVTFDGIPPDQHSTDLVMDLCEPDYAVLGKAIDEVEKKLRAQNAS